MTEQELQAAESRRAELAGKIEEMRQAANRGEWDQERENNWSQLNADYDANMATIEAHNAEVARRVEINVRADALRDAQNASRRGVPLGRDGASLDDLRQAPVDVLNRSNDLACAFQGWLRHADQAALGPVTNAHREAAQRCGAHLEASSFVIPLSRNYGQVRNALSSTDGPSGGYAHGESFVPSLERALLAYGGILQSAEVMRTASGEPLRWPTVNDTSNTGEQLGESASIGSSVDPTFGSYVWYAYKFSSKPILVPSEFLRDEAVGFASIIGGMLGERLGRIINTRCTTGSGASTCTGIVTGATLGVTAASATAITFNEFIDLEHSIDPALRSMGCAFMMHDTVLKAVRKLSDGHGRYLWQADANSGAPDTLNRYRYFINPDMASSVATTNKTVLFGRMSAYKVRQVGAIRTYRLEERYRDTDQTGFVAFSEVDGKLLDAGDHPVKYLQQA